MGNIEFILDCVSETAQINGLNKTQKFASHFCVSHATKKGE